MLQELFSEAFATGEVRVAFSASKALRRQVYQDPDEEVLVFAYFNPSNPPMPDFLVDKRGVRATLRFRGEFIPTFVPWESVHEIGCRDFTYSLRRARYALAKAVSPTDSEVTQVGFKRPNLRVIDGGNTKTPGPSAA